MHPNRPLPIAAIALLVLSLLFHLALAARVFSSAPGRIVMPDTVTYEQPAFAILQTGQFRSVPEKPDPEIVRTPGYPIFLAGVYRVCGRHRSAVVIVQILLCLGGLILTYRTCRTASGAFAALTLLALGVADLIYATSHHLILAEGLFTFLLLLLLPASMAMLRAPDRRKQLLWAAACGLLIAFAALTRPIAYFLPLAYGACLAVGASILGLPRKTALQCAGMVLLPCIVILGGWQMRNRLVAGSPEFSQIKNINLLRYRAARIVSLKEGLTLEMAQAKLEAELAAENPGASPTLLFEAYGKRARAIISKNPALLVRGSVEGFIKMMFIPGESIFLGLVGIDQASGPAGDLARMSPANFFKTWVVGRPFQFAVFLFVLFHLSFAYAGALGSLFLIRSAPLEERRLHLLCWLLILYFVALSSGPEAYARFRVPIAPFLYALAGSSYSRWIPWLRARLAR